jgi:hypothetical protein
MTSGAISFYYRVRIAETTTSIRYHTMALNILDGGGMTTSIRAASLSNLNRTAMWTKSTTTLTNSLAGRSVIVRFSDTIDDYYHTDFFVDTVSFSATVCP